MEALSPLCHPEETILWRVWSRMTILLLWLRKLGAPLPRFPVEACGVDTLMRLSLMKGAHADLSSTAWQEIGVKPGFGLSGIPQHSTRLSSCPSDLTAPNKSHRPLLCHPDWSEPGFPATRPSPTSTCAAFRKESRMKFANATNLHRKSGVAQWRDLLCAFPERNCPGESPPSALKTAKKDN
jgi:hypothetical protein